MTADEKRGRMVAKLMRMTTKKQIAWSVDDAGGGEVYIAKADGLRFRLYHKQYKQPEAGLGVMIGPWGSAPLGALTPVPTHLVFGIVLELLDEKSAAPLETITEFDPMPLLKDMYEFVRRSVSNVDAKIDEFLAREATHVQ